MDQFIHMGAAETEYDTDIPYKADIANMLANSC